MKTTPLFTNAAMLISGAVLGISSAQAQVTIMGGDMFNQIGQYYRAYANDPSTNVNVSALLGTVGGPQAWNFTTGPQSIVYRFDYMAASNATSGSDFVAAGARIAEQKTEESNPSVKSLLFFAQDPVKGRLDHGFYDPGFSASQPESVFGSALQDFPGAIHYGDTWQGSTVFDSSYSLFLDPTDPSPSGFPVEITYTSTAKVDAYGFVTLPGLGFLECLRVHELVQYDVAFDLGDGSLVNAGTQYGLNYYWLAPGHGIAVQINSTPSDSGPPPDNLPGGAAALVRMFETNHGDSGPPPKNTIQGLQITLGKSGGLLTWTAQPSLTSYRVDYSTNPADPSGWHPVGTTTANFVIDPAAGGTNAPARYYRVVGNN